MLALLPTGDTVLSGPRCWLFGVVRPGGSGEDVGELATLSGLESEEATVDRRGDADSPGIEAARGFLIMLGIWRTPRDQNSNPGCGGVDIEYQSFAFIYKYGRSHQGNPSKAFHLVIWPSPTASDGRGGLFIELSFTPGPTGSFAEQSAPRLEQEAPKRNNMQPSLLCNWSPSISNDAAHPDHAPPTPPHAPASSGIPVTSRG
ncbi:MAG: hypothetical protein Q9216_006177 [Gyalolechia sp. 2 TL-2023]